MRKDYINIAKSLPINASVKTLCDDSCGVTKSQSVRHTPYGYSRKCYRCGAYEFTKREDRTLDQIFCKQDFGRVSIESNSDTHVKVRDSGNYDAIVWLYAHGITDAIQDRHGIMYCTKYKRVYLPVYDTLTKRLNGYLLRGFSKDKGVPKYLTVSLVPELYWVHHAKDPNVVVLVEDILSAIKIAESGAGVSVMATLGTENIFGKFMASSLALVHPSRTRRTSLLCWFDHDKAGYKATAQVVHYKSVFLTMFESVGAIVSEDDPKTYTAADICAYIHAQKGNRHA